MHSAPQPSLFAPETTDVPTVFTVKSNPRNALKLHITFLFDRGGITLTKGLIELLGAEESRRVTFVNYKGQAYITRSDNPDHFWLNIRYRDKFGFNSAYIKKKQFVQSSLRQLGYGAGEEARFAVAPYQVTAAELHLDPMEFKYPLYRIVPDQKTLTV